MSHRNRKHLATCSKPRMTEAEARELSTRFMLHGARPERHLYIPTCSESTGWRWVVLRTVREPPAALKQDRDQPMNRAEAHRQLKKLDHILTLPAMVVEPTGYTMWLDEASFILPKVWQVLGRTKP